MDLTLTEDQELIQSTAREFLDSRAATAGIREHALMLRHFCFSPAVAEPLAAAGAAHLEVAVRPDEGSLLDLLQDFAPAASGLR